MIIIPCQQGDDTWRTERAGVITASMFGVARQRLKSGRNKGDFTAAARDYAFRLAVERISWSPLDEGFETWAMRRGHELEPEARAAHERRIGSPIQQTGLVLTDDHRFGASADGLIGDEGGAEYKCLVSPERMRPIIVDGAHDEFRDQVQGCLWLTGRAWWHLVLYCPALEPAGKELFIHEEERDEEFIEALERNLMEFERLVASYQEVIEAAETWRPARGHAIAPAPEPSPAPSVHGIFGGA